MYVQQQLVTVQLVTDTERENEFDRPTNVLNVHFT